MASTEVFPTRSAETLGHVAGESHVDAARPGALGAVHGEEAVDLRADVLKVARLVPQRLLVGQDQGFVGDE